MQRCTRRTVASSKSVSDEIRELMWPILLLAVGFAWHLSSEASRANTRITINVLYAALTAVLCWWLNAQFCGHHKAQELILLLAAAFTAMVVVMSAPLSPLAGLVLTIVLVWQLFAEQLKIPKIRIQLPSIRIRLPKLKVTQPAEISVQT